MFFSSNHLTKNFPFASPSPCSAGAQKRALYILEPPAQPDLKRATARIIATRKKFVKFEPCSEGLWNRFSDKKRRNFALGGKLGFQTKIRRKNTVLYNVIYRQNFEALFKATKSDKNRLTEKIFWKNFLSVQKLCLIFLGFKNKLSFISNSAPFFSAFRVPIFAVFSRKKPVF